LIGILSPDVAKVPVGGVLRSEHVRKTVAHSGNERQPDARIAKMNNR
jgi:hypothetical protein